MLLIGRGHDLEKDDFHISLFDFEGIIIRLRGQAVKTSPFHGGNTGSIPVGVIAHHADVAQLAEQLICNQQVIGSSPIIGFMYPKGFWTFSSVG